MAFIRIDYVYFIYVITQMFYLRNNINKINVIKFAQKQIMLCQIKLPPWKGVLIEKECYFLCHSISYYIWSVIKILHI